VTVAGGYARCVRHFVQALDNPAMTEKELFEMVAQELEHGQRFDELGNPIGQQS
jgi:hypothetical protein